MLPIEQPRVSVEQLRQDNGNEVPQAKLLRDDLGVCLRHDLRAVQRGSELPKCLFMTQLLDQREGANRVSGHRGSQHHGNDGLALLLRKMSTEPLGISGTQRIAEIGLSGTTSLFLGGVNRSVRHYLPFPLSFSFASLICSGVIWKCAANSTVKA